MDCCNTTGSDNSENKIEKGGEVKMNFKKIIPWIVIGILALVVIYIFFFKGTFGSGSAVSSAGQVIQSSAGMVGGC